MFKMMGMNYLKRGWAWVDLIILIISIAIMVQYIMLIMRMGKDGSFEQPYDDYAE